MNAKEYLEQIRELEHKIYCMKLRSEYYDKMSLSIPGPIYGEKIGSNPNRNTEAPFMKWLIKKDEIDREIIKLVEKLNLLKAEAIVKIEALENEDYKIILVKRYIEGCKWDDIADLICVSKSTLKRWHEESLKAMNKLNNYL